MDFIDKIIFLHNFNDELGSEDIILELEGVIRGIRRDCGYGNVKYPSTYKNNIQRLKQIVWILEKNNKRYV